MAGTAQVGVKAVIENYDQFINGLKQMTASLEKVGETTRQTSAPMKQMGMSADELVNKIAGMGIVKTIYSDFKQFAQVGIETAMAVERMSLGTESLAKTIGESGNAMVTAIQQASGGTIGGLAAMTAANQAVIMGVVKNKEEMADLTRIAVGLGRAMGKDAVSSLGDMTLALGRNSPRILDNLGLIVKEGPAHETYAAAIGKTVEALTEEEKRYAFQQAALEKGRQALATLGDTTDTAATKVEVLATKWGTLRTKMGELAIEASGPLLESVNNVVDRLIKGADAWLKIQQVYLPALEEMRVKTEQSAIATAIQTDNIQELGTTIVTTAGDAAELQRALVASTRGFKGYADLLDRLAAWAGESPYRDIIEALRMTNKQYFDMITLGKGLTSVQAGLTITMEKEMVATRNMSASMVGLGQAFYEGVGAVEAYDTASQRYVFITDTMAISRRNWVDMENKAKTDLQRIWDKMADDHNKALSSIRNAEANYINQTIDMQRNLAESASDAGKQYTDAIKDRNKSEQDAYESHSEKLQSIAEERAEKIQWVLEGGASRPAEQTEKDLAYWNAYYDAKVKKVEESYIKENNEIAEKLKERQAMIAEQQAKERAAAEEQRQSMALQASLQIVEASGKLGELTGIAGITAKETADLVNSGMLKLQGPLLTELSNAWGTLNTTMKDTTQTAQTNDTALTSLFNTTGTTADTAAQKADQAKTPLQAIGTDLGVIVTNANDVGTKVPVAMALAQKSFSDTGVKAALMTDEMKKVADDGVKSVQDVDWKQLGKDIIGGIIAGMEEMRPAARDAGAAVVKDIEDKSRQQAGAQSPSKVMMALGNDLGEGLIIGWNQSAQELPSDASDFLSGWFKSWWFGIRDQLGRVGELGRTSLFRDQLKSIMGGLTVSYGETYGQALEAMLDDYIKRLPEHAKNQLKQVTAVLRAQFPNLLQQLGVSANEPILGIDYLFNIASTISGAANTFKSLLQAQGMSVAETAQQAAYLDALRSGSLDLLRINQQMNDEYKVGLGLNQDLADLQTAQQQLQLLQGEKSLVDMIKEYGLSYQEVLGGITLGADTSVAALTQASIRALRLIINQTSTAMTGLPTAGLPEAPWSPAFPPSTTPLPEISPVEGGGSGVPSIPPPMPVYSGGIKVGEAPPPVAVSVSISGVTINNGMDAQTFGAMVAQTVADHLAQA